MANFKQCGYCNRIFDSYYGAKCCPECTEYLDQVFLKVRDYLYDNSNAGITKIVEELNVDEKAVLYLMKSQRLTVAAAASDPTSGIRCSVCGVPIAGGRLCEKCAGNLSDLQSRMSPSSSPREKTGDRSEGAKGGRKIGMHTDYGQK